MTNQEVKVQAVEYLSKDAKEALVHVTDGVYECIAFCQPCNKENGDLIHQPLLAFGTQGIETLDASEFSVQRIRSTLGYKICAKAIDIELGIVVVGAIRLELDLPLPGGVEVNSFVRFICQRIDLF